MARYHFAPQHGSNNFFNIGITWRHFGKLPVPSSATAARGDVNQLLGQIEVETKRAAKTRVYGCLLTPAIVASSDAVEAARDKIAPVSHEAAVRLYDVLADRLRQYAAVCGDGNAEARGDARTKTEALLPSDGWLGRLLAPTQGKVIGVEDVAGLFPPR